MTPTERVNLQHIEWNESLDLPRTLFYNGDADTAEDCCRIHKGANVSFDTYFNLFSYRKFRKYTTISAISFRIEIQGRASLRILGISRKNIKKKSRTLWASDIGNADSYSVLETDDLQIPEGIDYLYIEIEAHTEVSLRKASWIGSVPAVRAISLAIGICTCRREKELKRNIDEIIVGIYENRNSDFKESPDIFIVDNGHTLRPQEFRYPDKIKLFANRNYGGSAGFTRCMIEACLKSQKKYSHLLLMDDDALINSFVMERIHDLLRILKEEYSASFLGGALFSKSVPLLQKENGAFLGDYGSVRFYGRNTIMDTREQIVANEDEKEINYNGWFLCCIPAERIDEDTLPLPLFVRGDDQEFFKRLGAEFITMNGIAVWHPDPNTGRRPYMKYYDYRNELILASEFNKDLKKTAVCKLLIKSVLRSITKYEYENAWYTMRGVGEFYNGVESFLQIDPEVRNTELVNWKKYKNIDITQSEMAAIEIPRQKPYYIKVIKGITNLIMPNLIGRKVFRQEDTWISIDNFCTRQIIIVDPAGNKGIVLERNRREAIEILRKLALEIRLIIRVHNTVFPEWSKNIRSMQTLSFWEKLMYEEKQEQV